jgi:hypothetical protein
MLALTLFSACNQQKESTTPENDGYTLQNSANIEYAKKTLVNCAKGDLDAYKALYADSAIFHDNATKETLNQNIEVFKAMKAKGIEIKLDTIWTAFEEVPKVADPETGAKNYVHIYCQLTFSKGDIKETVQFYQSNALKGGKIIREWDYYDGTGINELMK